MEKQIEIIALGSCVSRVVLLDGDYTKHGISDERLKLKYFLDKQNIALQMMPPAFTMEEIDSITAEQLWDGGRIHTVHQALKKQTVELILNSNADYIVMDLFDFQTNFAAINETAFDTNAYEFMYTKLFRKYEKQISIFNFMQLPKWTYYPLVDLFFERIMEKFDADHIILNRFRANTYYLAKDGEIKVIPQVFRNPFQANDAYNRQLRELEDYVIKKYNPYVLDYSQYYMGDENMWDNLQGAHFELAFYNHSFNTIKEIIFNHPQQRVFDEVDLFGQMDGFSENLNIAAALDKIEEFRENNDILWFNVLAKLTSVCPEHPRVQEYLQMICDAE